MPYRPQTPLPPVRSDVQAIEVSPAVIALHDPAGYADDPVVLPIETVELLARMNGRRTALVILREAGLDGVGTTVTDFLKVVETLDLRRYLDSPSFRDYRRQVDERFTSRTLRPAAHAGSSYPTDPEALRRLLDGFLGNGGMSAPPTPGEKPVAVIAPHIDFRVGGASYGPAYDALRRSDAETFVLFGTSHQMSYDRFMVSTMDFDTPLGALPADRELIARFRELLPFEITRDEIAHRDEHSIEFQAVFLRHIFPDREIRIVPILTGSFHTFVELGRSHPGADERLTTLYETIGRAAGDLDRSICYVAGADMSHVGHKFGDREEARDLLQTVRQVDLEALTRAAAADADGFIDVLARERNRFRVCGTAPIYAALRSARPTRGELLCYDAWDEHQRSSAVTFASVALYR